MHRSHVPRPIDGNKRRFPNAPVSQIWSLEPEFFTVDSSRRPSRAARVRARAPRACGACNFSNTRPALVDLSRYIAVSCVSHSRFRRFSTCISAVSGVSLVSVSLLSADVAVAVVRPEVISQRVLIPRGRTRAHWKALAKAHTIVQ